MTAILAYNATAAPGCYFGLLRTGWTFARGAVASYYGQQLALMGFGDEPQAELTDQPGARDWSGCR